MFTVELLGAQRGDCLWLTYGEGDERHHVIIDGGPSETIGSLVPELERRLSALPPGDDRVELLVISHIDADHIQGIVSLLSDPARVRLFRDVWFNGFKHLPSDVLGAPDGERLTASLEAHPQRWNAAFSGKAVVVADDLELPKVRLRGGLELTLLSPTHDGLARLAPVWEAECRKAGLLPGHGAKVPASWQRSDILGWNVDLLASAPYRRDRAEANGSSIAFVATFDGRSVLCAADAHSEMLEQGLDRLGPGPHELTAVKLSHHGSRSNVSPGFLERVRARHWLISTDGARFHHPHPEALARVITTQAKPVFHLNHVTEDVEELIGDAGSRFSVKRPRKRRDGGYESGIVVRLA